MEESDNLTNLFLQDGKDSQSQCETDAEEFEKDGKLREKTNVENKPAILKIILFLVSISTFQEMRMVKPLGEQRLLPSIRNL